MEKRHHPQEDLISQLVQIEEEGDRLSEAELFSTIGLLIFAGHETTSNFIGNAVLTLLDHPDQLAKLKANLSLVPTAVEELLRFCGPVLSGVPRFATEDIELGGQHIAKGAFFSWSCHRPITMRASSRTRKSLILPAA